MDDKKMVIIVCMLGFLSACKVHALTEDEIRRPSKLLTAIIEKHPGLSAEYLCYQNNRLTGIFVDTKKQRVLMLMVPDAELLDSKLLIQGKSIKAKTTKERIEVSEVNKSPAGDNLFRYQLPVGIWLDLPDRKSVQMTFMIKEDNVISELMFYRNVDGSWTGFQKTTTK